MSDTKPTLSRAASDDEEKNAKNSYVASLSSSEDYETLDLFEGTIDPVYQAKARVLNHAIQEIGMGKYQVHIKCSVRR